MRVKPVRELRAVWIVGSNPAGVGIALRRRRASTSMLASDTAAIAAPPSADRITTSHGGAFQNTSSPNAASPSASGTSGYRRADY